MVFALRMVNPADGPLGEHPGWNGAALPGLQGAGYSPLLATAILAPLVAGWQPAHLLPGRGRLAAVRPREWPRSDDGGDVLVRVALQPHPRQHPAARNRAQPRREHLVRARLDRHGRVAGRGDRVGGLRPEVLARSRAAGGDDDCAFGTAHAQRSDTGDDCLARTLWGFRETRCGKGRDKSLNP